MKRIAVIGSNSYIARNLIYYLNQSKHDVHLSLYGSSQEHKDGEKNYNKINILSKESVSTIDMDCDYIFMFVGKTGSANGFEEYDTFIDINERSLLNILNEYRRQGSKAKIIFPSTRLIYKGKKELQAEDSEKEFKTIYAINKFACENYLKQYSDIYGIKYCIFRICVPYGTLVPNASSYGTAEFMMSKAIKGENISIYGKGSVRRTITYIEDLCKIMIEGAFNNKCINDVFNIGGENYSLKEMAEQIASIYNVSIDYIPWPEMAKKIESGDTVFDDRKLRKNLNFNYNMSFKRWINIIN